MNQTSDFLGDPATWSGARVTLDDVHGLWGGHRIMIEGDGHVVVETVGPARGQSGHVEAVVSLEEAHTLLAECVNRDLVSIQIPLPPTLLPDSVCTRLTLRNANGQDHIAIGWTGSETHPHFDALVRMVLDIATRVQPSTL